MNTKDYPNDISVRAIIKNWETIKKANNYNIESWLKKEVWEILDTSQKDFWFEWEWYFIDNEWNPIVFYKWRFLKINELNNKKIKKISQEFSDNLLHSHFRNWDNSFNTYANLCWELDLSTYEIGFNNWLSIKEIFFKIIDVYKDLNQYYNWWVKYLPYWILPIKTPNITNLSNSYYKYIFEERDWFDWIADFRWAWLQFHKEMDNYELSIYTFNKIRHLLPIFQVLAQNSPFRNWIYNWNLSERTASKFKWKMTWIPNSIDNNFINQLQNWLNTSINSVTPYYYAVRYPRIDIKTIENCSMDSISDLPLLFSLLDLYYRITEKLKQCFLNWEELPKNIFWTDCWDFIETNILQENYNKSIRNWTKSKYHILWNWDKKITFENFLNNIFLFIKDIPSQFPEWLAKKFWLRNCDPTFIILSNIAKNWNLAENTLKDFWITRTPGISIEIPDKEIKQHILEVSKKFQQQLNLI